MSASFSRAFAISSVRSVAQFTGGMASVREDVGKALARVDAGTKMKYLLGYYPTDEKWNGKYRRIEVKVRRPGIKVAYRHGYFATETVPAYNREGVVASSRISAALGYAPDLGDISFRINPVAGFDLLGPPRIRIDFQVDAGNLGLKMTDGVYTGKLYAAVFYGDQRGNYLGDNRGTIDINLDAAEYAETMKSGIRFFIIVPHKTSRQMLKAIVYDPATDRIGSKSQTVER